MPGEREGEGERGGYCMHRGTATRRGAASGIQMVSFAWLSHLMLPSGELEHGTNVPMCATLARDLVPGLAPHARALACSRTDSEAIELHATH